MLCEWTSFLVLIVWSSEDSCAEAPWNVELYVFTFLRKCLFLFERQYHKQKALPSAASLPRRLQQPSVGPAREMPRARNCIQVSHMGGQVITSCFPGTLTGSWIASGIAGTRTGSPVWDAPYPTMPQHWSTHVCSLSSVLSSMALVTFFFSRLCSMLCVGGCCSLRFVYWCLRLCVGAKSACPHAVGGAPEAARVSFGSLRSVFLPPLSESPSSCPAEGRHLFGWWGFGHLV